MKKIISIILCSMMLCALAVPALAANAPVITCQPQNPTYNVGAVAEYSITAMGEGMKCTWYLVFDGVEYDLSKAGSGAPWEGYAGASYGPREAKNGNFTTFTYSFGGIEGELSGSSIYAVISNGAGSIKSDVSYVSLMEGAKTPPAINVPASMEIYQGEILDLYCSATAFDGSALSYIWYETSSGKLFDIVAVNRGAETASTFRCDTSTVGTRYYVCGVTTANGGVSYSSVIPVTVMKKAETVAAPVITTKSLPEMKMGEAVYLKLDCTDPDAAFSIYKGTDKVNDFPNTGLNLTQHGELEGTPEKAGTYTFTVMARGEGGVGYMTYTLKVTAPIVETTASPETEETTDAEATDAETTAAETTEAETEKAEPSKKSPKKNNALEDTTEKAEKTEGLKPWTIALIIIASAAVIGGGAAATFIIIKKKKQK